MAFTGSGLSRVVLSVKYETKDTMLAVDLLVAAAIEECSSTGVVPSTVGNGTVSLNLGSDKGALAFTVGAEYDKCAGDGAVLLKTTGKLEKAEVLVFGFKCTGLNR